MRFTVIGSGAVGGTVGAHLVRSGHEVLFCDTDIAHVRAMARDGLRLDGPAETFTVPARAVLPADLPDELGVVLLCVKTQHTREAVASVAGRLGPQGYVLTLQNGLTTGIVAEAVGADRVVVGFVNFGADLVGPGRIKQGNVATFRVGEPSGPRSQRVRDLVEALPWAEASDSILGYLWAKKAYGAMLFATAVSDLAIADALADPAYRPLFMALAREVLHQSPVPPMAFDGFDPADLEGSIDRLVVFNRASTKTHTGIYRDLTVRRRPTEVDGLLGDLTGPLTTHVGLLIKAIERGERHCERAGLDLLVAYEAAERLGRPLDAVVSLLPAPARATAGPLLGIAVAVKDMIDVAGQPRGNGNPTSMNGPSRPVDAPVVARLRAAGADVFALSSLLEYAAGAQHPDLGEARNPVDPRRTAGGSSGGSAALVGAGVCRLAVGTDTGGSVRIPAAYCGVVGLKPTSGLLPVDGVEPLAPTCDHVGLLASDSVILRRALAALTGNPPGPPLGDRLRLGLLHGQLDHPGVQPDVATAVRTALELVRAEGHAVVEVDGSVLDELGGLLGPIVLHEAWLAHRDRFAADPGSYGPETRRLLEQASTVRVAEYQQALARRTALLPAAGRLLDGLDALVGPCVPFVAPPTTPPFDTAAGDLEGLFTGAYDVTGQPALSLPCGAGADGLPVGLQLAGRTGDDDWLLAVAEVVEQCLRTDPGVLRGPG